jgi:hypothetical protein
MAKLEGCVTDLKEEEKERHERNPPWNLEISYIYLFHKDDNIAFFHSQ